MNPLLSAKGENVTAWRAVEDFATAYRQALLDLAVVDRSGNFENVLSETCASLETALITQQTLVKSLNTLIEEVSTVVLPAQLKKLTEAYFTELYRHFGHFRSVLAFYQLSMAFLQQISAVIITQATARLGLSASQLPKIALIAVGSAGRGEYSPFVPLQILIVHEEVQAQNQTIDLFCQYLHAGFEAAGLSIDSDVTPQNPNWRGTLVEWQQRCEDGMHPQTELELINIWRLVDQCPLCPGDGFALELKPICAVALNGSRLALTNLFERMILLSNGLGIMGRLKLERSGSERGLFRLQEHGLLPLSAAISALALIKGSQAVSTCNRVHDLLKHGELDVDLAERMLSTWYSLHDLRLRREQSCHLFEPSSRPSFLNPDELTVDQRQTLKKNLETVAKIQRQVEVIYSGIGDKIL